MACVVCQHPEIDEGSNPARPLCARCHADTPRILAEQLQRRRRASHIHRVPKSVTVLDVRLANSGPQDAPSALSEMRSEKEDRRR